MTSVTLQAANPESDILIGKATPCILRAHGATMTDKPIGQRRMLNHAEKDREGAVEPSSEWFKRSTLLLESDVSHC